MRVDRLLLPTRDPGLFDVKVLLFCSVGASPTGHARPHVSARAPSPRRTASKRMTLSCRNRQDAQRTKRAESNLAKSFCAVPASARPCATRGTTNVRGRTWAGPEKDCLLHLLANEARALASQATPFSTRCFSRARRVEFGCLQIIRATHGKHHVSMEQDALSMKEGPKQMFLRRVSRAPVFGWYAQNSTSLPHLADGN